MTRRLTPPQLPASRWEPAALFGFTLYATARASDNLPIAWVLLPARLMGTLVIAAPLALAGRLRMTRQAVPLVLLSGFCEVLGLTAFALGSRDGVAVTAVIGSQFAGLSAVAAFVGLSRAAGTSPGRGRGGHRRRGSLPERAGGLRALGEVTHGRAGRNWAPPLPGPRVSPTGWCARRGTRRTSSAMPWARGSGHRGAIRRLAGGVSVGLTPFSPHGTVDARLSVAVTLSWEMPHDLPRGPAAR